MPDEDVATEIYANIFDDMSEDWETIVNARDTESETALIQSILSKEGVTLDLCCGTGRHSSSLCTKNWKIIGLDLSHNLLTIAKRNMKRKKIDIPIVRADMRRLPFRDQAFSAIFCMFTSFGYLPSENDDIKTFKEIKRILRNSGKFLLDVANKNYVINVFKEKEWAEYKSFYMLEKRSLDLRQSKLMSEWVIIRKDKDEARFLQHNLRLYSFRRLKQMLGKAGLEVKQVYGSYKGEKFSLGSSRMILATEKKF